MITVLTLTSSAYYAACTESFPRDLVSFPLQVPGRFVLDYPPSAGEEQGPGVVVVWCVCVGGDLAR